MAAGNSINIFTHDWLGAPDLRMCSLAGRGLWFDMLCLAVDADDSGRVTIAGQPADAQLLARAVRADLGDVEAALADLEMWKVFSRDAQGRIYCRRLARSSRTSSQQSQKALKGMGSKSRNNKGKFEPAGSRIQPPSPASSPLLSIPDSESQNKSPSALNPEAQSLPKGPPTGVSPGKPATPDLQLQLVDPDQATQALRAKALDAYNQLGRPAGWVAALKADGSRGKALDATLKRIGLEAWIGIVRKASTLRFFDCNKPRGGAHDAWRPSIEFFLKRSSIEKITEGFYDRYGHHSADEPIRDRTGGARLASFGLAGKLDS